MQEQNPDFFPEEDYMPFGLDPDFIRENIRYIVTAAIISVILLSMGIKIQESVDVKEWEAYFRRRYELQGKLKRDLDTVVSQEQIKSNLESVKQKQLQKSTIKPKLEECLKSLMTDEKKNEDKYLTPISKETVEVIDTQQKFLECIKQVLSKQPFVAVSMETSDNSYEGFICLISISYFDKPKSQVQTYVIDILSTFLKIPQDQRQELIECLGKHLFENENILKLFHGAIDTSDSQIGWLQRDFGIQCQNVLDTQKYDMMVNDKQKVRSLYDLGQKYCGDKWYVQDKSSFIVQGDAGQSKNVNWVQRPLKIENSIYSASKSHFLIHITLALINEAKQNNIVKTIEDLYLIMILTINAKCQKIQYVTKQSQFTKESCYPLFKNIMKKAKFDKENNEHLMMMNICLALYVRSERIAREVDTQPNNVLSFNVIMLFAKEYAKLMFQQKQAQPQKTKKEENKNKGKKPKQGEEGKGEDLIKINKGEIHMNMIQVSKRIFNDILDQSNEKASPIFFIRSDEFVDDIIRCKKDYVKKKAELQKIAIEIYD